MQIFVKPPYKNTLCVSIDPNESYAQLKQKVGQRLNIDPDTFQLYSGTKFIDNNKSWNGDSKISEIYIITADCTLYLKEKIFPPVII